MSPNRPAGQTIPERILAHAAVADAEPFLRLLTMDGTGEAYTYADLVGRAAAWTALYHERGLQPRARIVVILQHSLDLYAAYVGALLGGHVPAMFAFPSPKFSEQEYFKTIDRLLANAGPDLLVVYPELRDKLEPVVEQVGGGTQTVTADALPAGDAGLPAPVEVAPDAVAFLQYSSGTTGLRKGVAITHRALLWQVDRYAEAIGLSDGDRIASWLPLYHDMGLIACFFLPLLRRTPLVALSPFDWVRRPLMLPEAMSRYRGTLAWLPNFAFRFMARNISELEASRLDLRHVRKLVNCSEPLMIESMERFARQFYRAGLPANAFASCYAMAENTFAVTSGGFGAPLRLDSIDRGEFARTGRATLVPANAANAAMLVSSGRPLPDTQVRIVAPDGATLGERQTGEIVLRTPCLLAEYYRNPQQTAASLRDGWYHTGDLGYLADGELYVAGRKKDVIIVAGCNVHPQDVEAIVDEVPGAIPGRCAAVGVRDDEQGTEKLIILAETHQTDPGRQREIRQAIYTRVASRIEAVPGDIRLVPPRWLAKSSSGKIARPANRQRYLELLEQERQRYQTRQFAEQRDADELERRVIDCVHRVLARSPAHKDRRIDLAEPLITSGLIDSLMLVSLVLEVESALGLTVPTGYLDLAIWDTAGSIAAMLRPMLAGGRPGAAELPSRCMTVKEKKCFDYLDGPRDFDAVIVGSSRVQMLHTPVAAEFGYKAYNFAVDAERPEGWYCVLRFVLEHTRTPLRLVLLGIDVDGFSNKAQIEPRLMNSTYLVRYLDEPVHPEEHDGAAPRDLAAELPDVQQERFKAVLQQYKQGAASRYPETTFDPTTGDCVVPDNPRFNRREPLVCAEPLELLPDWMLHYYEFTHLHRQRLQYFARTLDLCIEHDIDVIGFFPTFHPAMEAALTAKTRHRPRLDDLIGVLSQLRHPRLFFYDTSAVESFDGDPDDFRDGTHLGAVNADRLLRWLLRAYGQDRKPVLSDLQPAAAAT